MIYDSDCIAFFFKFVMYLLDCVVQAVVYFSKFCVYIFGKFFESFGDVKHRYTSLLTMLIQVTSHKH